MGDAATGRLIIVRKKGDAHDLGRRCLTKGELRHVGEVDGGGVVHGFECTGGIEMASSRSTAAEPVRHAMDM